MLTKATAPLLTMSVPEVLSNELLPWLSVADNAYQATHSAHALVIATEWDEFKRLDFAKIYAGMHQPAFVFDGRNILDLPALRELGFRVAGIGK